MTKYIFGKIAFLIFVFAYLISLTSVQAQEYTSPALEWKPDPGFSQYIQNIFQKQVPNIVKLLNYSGIVSTVAVPTSQTPVKEIKELEPGKTIGAIFLSTGSLRLKLPPGAYRVFVLKKGNKWRAQFFDGNNRVFVEVPAQVRKASPVTIPFAYVDRSICHRFDETLVCY